ncbi:MAG: hypothetical protein RLY20_3460 [Verrucomicrobiota bacterium]|jgi:hypothetical protein
MRVTWIGGWGVAPESLRPLAEKYFPESKHEFLAPVAAEVTRRFDTHTKSASSRRRLHEDVDLTIAWSLGAWRLLEAASRGVEIPGMVLLLAPFVAFPSESKLGGKCSATQVKFLRRWLQREPLAALADFYQRAVLGAPPTELPYPASDLLEGLDRLAEDASPALCAFAARGLPRNWQALIGDDDALLDAESVRVSLPGCVRVRDAGHAIADLLRASQA